MSFEANISFSRSLMDEDWADFIRDDPTARSVLTPSRDAYYRSLGPLPLHSSLSQGRLAQGLPPLYFIYPTTDVTLRFVDRPQGESRFGGIEAILSLAKSAWRRFGGDIEVSPWTDWVPCAVVGGRFVTSQERQPGLTSEEQTRLEQYWRGELEHIAAAKRP